MLELFDRLPLEGVRITADGYLTATAKVARTGIQEYAGYEVDPDNKHGLRDKAIVKIYRPADQVFSDAALRSFAHRPMTNDHPPVLVTADNWKQYSIGTTGDEVDARDGKFVRVPLAVMDGAAIKDIQDGKRELSMGYQTILAFDAGTTPEGEEYDAVQTDMRMNHLAVVHRARGGDKLKIGDHKPQGDRLMQTKIVTVDGLQVETTDAGAIAIDKLKGIIASQDAANQTVLAAKDAEIARLNGELATKDAAIEAANGKVLNDAALDARVAVRAKLIGDAAAIAPDVKLDGLSDDAIRTAVVTKALGDAAVAGKPQSYVDARFDILVEDAASNGKLNAALGGAATAPMIAGDAAAQCDQALDASVADINAWRNKA